jgi:hypothetical protein
METNANADPEIRREKVLVPQDMCLKEMTQKYGISKTCAFNAKKRGWFIKNYGRNQVIIDRGHFHPESAYGIARKVFWKRFKWNPIAISIMEDMIQQAAYLMYAQSGKIKAGATEKYNDRYGFYWCAYNAMLVYLIPGFVRPGMTLN